MPQSYRNSFGHLVRLALLLGSIGIFLMYWVESYFVEDSVSYQITTQSSRSLTQTAYIIQSGYGGLSFHFRRRTNTFATQQEALNRLRWFQGPSDRGISWHSRFDPKYPLLSRPAWLGFDCRHDVGTTFLRGFGPLPFNVMGLVMPYWVLTPLVAIAPFIAVRRWRKRRRIALGQTLCQNCGYDLRASPDRCPECGTLRREMHAPIASS